MEKLIYLLLFCFQNNNKIQILLRVILRHDVLLVLIVISILVIIMKKNVLYEKNLILGVPAV